MDAKPWIEMVRRKTGREFAIPLLPQAAELLRILAPEEMDGFLLPRISNQKINSYLKEIGEIIGIDKRLTHHTARKTFATTVLLYNDIPIEIVSKLLGHADIAVTQRSYAEVLNRSISNHMTLLQQKLAK